MANGKICEVGPRDGLQSHPRVYDIDTRFRFIAALVKAGLTKIETGSMVRPDFVPAMAGSDELFLKLKDSYPESVWKNFILLVPNEKGLDNALKLGCRFVAFFSATSEAFNQKNIKMNVPDSIRRIQAMMQSLPANIQTRLYVSTVFDCPYDGTMDPVEGLKPFEDLMNLADETSLGDTTGKAEVSQIEKTHEWLQQSNISEKVWWHFHDTYQKAEANTRKCLELGYTAFDSSAGGIGGCPFAPGAKGNIATEKLLSIFDSCQIEHSVNRALLQQASELLK